MIPDLKFMARLLHAHILRIAALATIGCLAMPSNAADETWIELGRTDTAVFEGRAGSLEFGVTERSNSRVATIIVRMRKTAASTDRSVTFEKSYVKFSDCERGYGKLVTTDLDGEFRYSNDFVSQGTNIASAIADVICLMVARRSESDEERVKPIRPATPSTAPRTSEPSKGVNL